MAVSDRRLLTGRGQSLQGEFPHRLQHQVARFAAWTVLLPQQALLHQRRHAVQDVDRQVVPAGDRLGRLQREATDKDGEPAKETLVLRGQQVVAPGDGVAHRLLPGGQVAPAAVSSGNRFSNRVSNADGGTTLTRAAASSIARGRPSKRRQMSRSTAALSGVRAKSPFTACARSTKSRTAAESIAS